jgi:hypothetical protein
VRRGARLAVTRSDDLEPDHAPLTVLTPRPPLILAGGANGITPPLLNGTEMPVPNGMAAAAERALNKPTISVEREGFLRGNYRARVTAGPGVNDHDSGTNSPSLRRFEAPRLERWTHYLGRVVWMAVSPTPAEIIGGRRPWTLVEIKRPP